MSIIFGLVLLNTYLTRVGGNLAHFQPSVVITLSPQAVKEYQPYKDYELPPTYQGDFHGNRREERNRFLLEVTNILGIV